MGLDGACKFPHVLRQSHAHQSLFTTRVAPAFPHKLRRPGSYRNLSCADPAAMTLAIRGRHTWKRQCKIPSFLRLILAWAAMKSCELIL